MVAAAPGVSPGAGSSMASAVGHAGCAAASSSRSWAACESRQPACTAASAAIISVPKWPLQFALELIGAAPSIAADHHRRGRTVAVARPDAAPALGDGRVGELEQPLSVHRRDVDAFGALR